MHRVCTGLLVATLVLLPNAALAGMPIVQLTDIVSMRLNTISFLLLVILLVGLGIQRLWNRLHLDFPRLPRLSYRGALAFVLLWGLAFHLVLTMISGARELMTPGAWVREGSTYELRKARPASQANQLRLARRQQLERLRVALWQHAERNEGHFPPDDFGPEIPESLWTVLDPARLHYVYVNGSAIDASRTPLAFEPGIYGRERWVLFTNGEIETLPVEEIYAALPRESS